MKIVYCVFILLLATLAIGCTAEEALPQIELDQNALYMNRAIHAQIETVPPSFTIIYEFEEEELDLFLADFGLQKDSTFSIEGNMRVVEAHSINPISSAIELGKEISNYNQVLMVKVNNASPTVSRDS